MPARFDLHDDIQGTVASSFVDGKVTSQCVFGAAVIETITQQVTELTFEFVLGMGGGDCAGGVKTEGCQKNQRRDFCDWVVSNIHITRDAVRLVS